MTGAKPGARTSNRPARASSSPRGTIESRLEAAELRAKDLEVELSRAERRVEAMKEIGRVLGSSLELDPLLREIVRKATDLLDADRATLFVADPDRRELFSTVMQGGERFEIRLPYGKGLAGWVAENDRPVAIRDAYSDERFNRDVDLKTGYRTRGMLVWPIRRPGGGVIGVIQVLNKNTGTFDAEDERLLEAIASEIGVALEVARLYRQQREQNEALERARSELSLLFETERSIAESTGLEPMLQAILDKALSTLSARSGIVWLSDDRGLSMSAHVASGARRPGLEKLFIDGNDPVYRSTSRGQTLVVHGPQDGATYRSPGRDGDVLRRGRVAPKQLVAVPIAGEEGVIGAIELFDKKPGFSTDDVRALLVVATQAGRAIAAERQRTERARAERLETIGRMLSGVVHDMRTPLTLISGYAELMTESDDAIDRKRYSEKILKQIDVMSGMTMDLLGFAKGERSVLLRKVHFGRFLSEIEEYLKKEFEGTKVELTLECEFRGVAHFDETKMRRVIHNIGRNARQAMPSGGKFRLAAWVEGPRLWMELEDTGPGIPKELEHRLFEPFATAGKPGGTGLGLAMVKQTIEEHGGRIRYTSSSAGTKFTIWIPLEGFDAPSAPAEKAPEAS